MSGMRIANIFIALLVTLPIYLYLLYKILESVQASELMWFLYWVYVPFIFAGALLSRLLDKEEKK